MNKINEIEDLIKMLVEIEKDQSEVIDVTPLIEAIKRASKIILQNNYQDIESKNDETTNLEISRWVTAVCTLKETIQAIAKKIGVMGDYLPTIRFGVTWIENGRSILFRLLSVGEYTPSRTIKEFIRMTKISRIELNSKRPDEYDQELVEKNKDHYINVESIIHRVIENGQRNMIEQIEALHSMGASLEVCQFQGFNKQTPLDCSVLSDNIELFKYLINKGVGEKALHNNVNRFYKKQPKEIKNHLRPYIKKLLIINPKIAWRLAFDEIFTNKSMAPSDNRLCKTSTMDERYITPTIYSMIFNTNDGTPKKTTTTNAINEEYSSRAITSMESHGNVLNAKFQPKFPAMELITIKFTQNLFGETPPYSELIKIDNYPIMVTQKVEGDTLRDVITSSNPEDRNKLLNLDASSMSKLLISEMLINPANGSFNDFIVSPILNNHITDETPQKYQLIRIDNELSFVPSSPIQLKSGLFGNKNSASVGTCLYLLNEMNDQVHQDVIDRFIELDITTFLSDWLFSVVNTHNTSMDLFNENYDSIQHFHPEDKTYVGVSLPFGQIQLLYSKMKRIKNILSKKRYYGNLTHWQLLEIVDPTIANMYRPFLPSNQQHQQQQQQPTSTTVASFTMIQDKFKEFQTSKQIQELTSSFIYESRGIVVKSQKQTDNERKELLEIEKKIEEIKVRFKGRERDPITEKNFIKLLDRKKIIENSLSDEIQEFASIKDEEIQLRQLLEKVESNLPLDVELGGLKSKSLTPSPLSTTTGVVWETLIESIDFSKQCVIASHQSIFDIIATIRDLRFYRIRNSTKLTIETFRSSSMPSIGSIKKVYITNCQTLLNFQNASLLSKTPLSMPSLTHFKVDQCKKLTTIKLDAPNLLSFSSTNCSELAEWDLKAPKLRKLKIQANQIGSQTMSTFEKTFPLLSYLDISRIVRSPSSKNSVTTLELSHWKHLETVVADGVISIEKLSITSQLTKLKTINLKGCQSLKEIQSSGNQVLSVCPILQKLDLTDTLIPVERHSQQLYSLNNMKRVVICGLNDILSFSSSINLFDDIANGVAIKSPRNKVEEVIHMGQLFQYNYSIEPTIPQRLFQQIDSLVLLMDSSNIQDSTKLFEKYCHHLKTLGNSQKANRPKRFV